MIDDYTVVDLEMTGLSPKTDKIIEIGAIKVREGKPVDTYGMLVNPETLIPALVTELTGITDEMVAGGVEMDQAVSGLIDFIGDDILVGHNISFDYSFIKQWAINHKISISLSATDTLTIARTILPPDQPKKLSSLCQYFNINRENAHRAVDDAAETMELFEKLKELLTEKYPAAKQEEILKPRPLIYKAKRQTPATRHQIERLKEYMASKNIKDSVDFDNLTRGQASRLQDQYYSKFGR